MSPARPGCAHAVVLGLLCAVVLCSCRSTGAPRTSNSVSPGTEQVVWGVLIREAYVSSETKMVVLDPELEWGGSEWNWGPKPQGVPGDAWQALLHAFRHGGSLPRNIDPGKPVAWFENKDFHQLPDGGDIEGRWPAFHERYPGNSGHISLSRIGFSRDGRTALVYGFVGSGSLSASGDLFVLRKTDQGWRLVKTHNYAMA